MIRKIEILQRENNFQKNIINQHNLDKGELEFLRLNLKFGHKCRRTFFNNSGFIVGSKDYKNCVLSKGIKNNG